MPKTVIFLNKSIMANPYLFNGARALHDKGKPVDYYKGTPGPVFDIPRNIVSWFLTGDEDTRLDSFHYRFILVADLGCDGSAIVDQRVLPLKAGAAILIFPFQYHHFVKPSGPRLWLFIGFEGVTERMLEPLKNRSFAQSAEFRAETLRFLKTYPAEKPADSGSRRSSLVVASLLNEALLTVKNKPAAPGKDKSALAFSLSARVQRWFHSHMEDKVSVAEAARTFNLSESHLRLTFRKEMGLPPGRMFADMRFEKAKGLLSATSLRIADIADKAGFESVFAFSTAFKRRYRMSPRAFRNQLR